MSVTFTAGMQAGAQAPAAAPAVNVNNRNALTLLHALGYRVDPHDHPSGEVPPEEFHGRVLVALALEPADEGVPPREALETSRFVNCGRHPGYLQERLADLHQLAMWCQERNAEVIWS